MGRARVVTPNVVEVLGSDGAVTLVEADHILVATGSRPRVPDGITVDGQLVVTSDHLEEFPDFPKSMVVVGAGVVGCESATIFANFGRSKINLIDRAPRILPFEDTDVAGAISANFLRAGMTIHSDSSLESLKVVDGQVEYVIVNAAGQRQKIRVERALISVGRVPATRGLGLEELGVSIEKSGGIEVRNTQSTTVPNIWAAGDATMDLALVNVAELEGRHAVERMFGLDPAPIRYEALSAIMFLMPEIASVGLNELQAQKKQVPYRVSVLHNALINRNIAMRSTDGFIKLLASRTAPSRVLGLRVVGPMASSTIQGIAFLIEQRATLEDIDYCVHPHPAITEGVQECARILLGRSIHKVEVFSDLLRAGEG
jgi:dihydrolipoamide dehydrogenase